MAEPQAVYDAIAKEYKESKGLAFRRRVEEHTLFLTLASPAGLSILDLACGEGIYSRKLVRAGAARVVGVDVSARMVELAERSERAEPLGVRYLVADVLELDCEEKGFDAVVGMYLLNYARSAAELESFCRRAFEHLRPGGRFVGFNDNPANRPEHFGDYRKYGFVKHGKSEKEGDPVTYELFNDEEGTSFRFENFYIPPPEFNKAFAAAGFVDFLWQGPFLSKEEEDDSAFWAPFMSHPPVIGFSAARPL